MNSINVSVNYFRVEAAEEDYFKNFQANAREMLVRGDKTGDFESGDAKYQWELLEEIEDSDRDYMYLFSCAKERKLWPVWMTDDGCMELALPNGDLGDISYCIVSPSYGFVLCTGNTTMFKKLLGQFSPEGVVRLIPIFREDIHIKVLGWDIYKKVGIKMFMPNQDQVVEFVDTKTGGLIPLLAHLGGLKVDITVSTAGKETLSNAMVKDLLPELLANNRCISLVVSGSDSEYVKTEQYDLKNAQIKYAEQIDIEGKSLTQTDIKQVLMRAMNEWASLLYQEDK